MRNFDRLVEIIEGEADAFVRDPDMTVEEFEWSLNWLIWGDDVPERFRVEEPA